MRERERERETDRQTERDREREREREESERNLTLREREREREREIGKGTQGRRGGFILISSLERKREGGVLKDRKKGKVTWKT